MISRSTWILGIVLVVAAAVVQPAHADGDAKAAARAHFKRAEAAFNLGKFDDALAAYQAAYETKPLPGFLFNIAQCHRNLGNHERALFFYRRYLALDPQTANRAVVEQLIDETEKRREAAAAANAVTPPSATLAPPPATAQPVAPAVAAPPVAAAPPVLAAAEPSPPSSPLPPSDHSVVQAAEPEPRPTFVQASSSASPGDRPLYRRWGFWAAVGAVVAAGTATAILLSHRQGTAAAPTGGLGSIDWR
jgi:hypothetical protein